MGAVDERRSGKRVANQLLGRLDHAAALRTSREEEVTDDLRSHCVSVVRASAWLVEGLSGTSARLEVECVWGWSVRRVARGPAALYGGGRSVMSYQDFRKRDGRAWLPRNRRPAAARERRRGSCVCLAVAPAIGSFTNGVRGQPPQRGHSTPSQSMRPKGPRSPAHSHRKTIILLSFQPSLDLSSASLSAIRTQRQMSPMGQT